jgi:DNA polymerase-3 subunit epsilon
VLKEFGQCASPCDGTLTIAAYEEVVADFRSAIDTDPRGLLTPLEAGMADAAAARRFEAARRERDRIHLLARALLRLRLQAALCAVEVLVAARQTDAGVEIVRIERGHLVASGLSERTDDRHLFELATASELPLDVDEPAGDEEVRLLLDWLSAPGVRVVQVDGTWATAVGTGSLARRVEHADRLARRLRRDRQVLTDRKVTARAA